MWGTVALLLEPSPVLGWGDRGHEITGVIAYARLSATAKRNVNALLATDRDTLTAQDFISRTTWADEYRDSDRQSTRRRYEQTRNWHFVNIDIADGRVSGCNPKLPAGISASAGPPNACILDKIDQFAGELRKPSTPGETLLALKFLLHLIGDLHHPLHIADNRDRGGNDVTVAFANPPRRENLHSYWDNYLVQRLGDDSRSVGRTLERQITPIQAQAWSKGTPRDWAKEAFQQGKFVAYNFHAGRKPGSARPHDAIHLGEAYERRAIPLVREQLAKAGVRLASVLNEIFK